jgi:two-component sensor histidine kinase
VETPGELLDPEAWKEILSLCARSMRVAVALTGSGGQLLGICHNPQPIWSSARNARPEWGKGCPFCLRLDRDPSGECCAAAEAKRTGGVVLVHDRAGFAHVAVPLSFGDYPVGTLLAGQVFDKYPEPLALDRVAREFGLSPQGLWNVARGQVPVSGSSLRIFGSLLHTLGQALLAQRYGTILKQQLASSDAELQSTNLELEEANLNLLAKVAELGKSNGEKEVLMQEVHHRVNNNLQVISSLLRLQGGSSEDRQLTDALRTTQLRIDSMALIHAQLYQSSDLREVRFGDYIKSLTDNLLLAYGVDRERIAMSVAMDTLKMTVDQAITAGLILNELISNSLKYAFPERRHGSIFVEGGRQENRIELTVRDDGVGLEEGQSRPKQRTSRGLQIVNVLCSQLRATLERTRGAGEPGPGTIFRISFVDKGFLAS